MTSTCFIDDRTRLEHLVDRVLSNLLPGTIADNRRTLVRLIQQARAARKAGQMNDALATLSSLDTALAPRDLACWAYNEWLAAARAMYATPNLLLYQAATGQAAVLEPAHAEDTVTVLAALAMDWEPGKVLSRRSLRGIRPLRQSGDAAGGALCP